MPKFYVKFSGSVIVEADNQTEAEKQARQLADCCGFFWCEEIGKDVDDNGWPIRDEDEPHG